MNTENDLSDFDIGSSDSENDLQDLENFGDVADFESDSDATQVWDMDTERA